MKPQRRNNVDYERVKTGDFINGRIIDIQYDEEHEFKFKGDIKMRPACRFVFELEGYKFKHYTRWITFSYGEKTNLYKKYLENLVLGAMPDMDFDLDQLKGMSVKTIWKGEDFQSIELIRPIGNKLGSELIKEPIAPASVEDLPEEESSEDIGFPPEEE